MPTPRPGQLLVLAHLRTHQGDAPRRLVEAAGCRVRCLPASSPARSPIAEACAKVKALLRRAEARTVAALEAAIGRVGLAA